MSKKSKKWRGKEWESEQILLSERTGPVVPTPTLYISEDVRLALHELSKRPLEWCLHGKTEFYKDGVRLVDFIVPKQENGAAHSDVSEEAFIEITEALLDRGEDLTKWNCTIHSHNTMGAFFSGGDQTRMDEWGRFGVPLFFSIVVSNKDNKLNLLCWSNFYKPLRVDIETTVVYEQNQIRPGDDALMSEIEALDIRLQALKVKYRESCMGWSDGIGQEIEAKTTKPAYDYSRNNGGAYGAHSSYDWEDDDWGTPIFDKNGALSFPWVREWLKFNEWTISGWEDCISSVDTWKPANKAQKRFLGLIYATNILIPDMNRLVEYLKKASQKQWDDFITIWKNVNAQFKKEIGEFDRSPFIF